MSDKSVKTIKLGQAQYAKVADRLKEFRTDFQNSKIETDYNEADGTVTFRAFIWKDKSSHLEVLKEVKDVEIARGSADSSATARSTKKGEKDFEKLETIAIGRALALLGYLSSGEVASFEEMEEFQKYKDDQRREYIEQQVGLFAEAKTMDELKVIWAATDKSNLTILQAKDARKAELEAKVATA